MAILFVLGIGLVLLAIVLIGSALSTSTQSGVTRSLAVLEAMTNAPEGAQRGAREVRSASGCSTRCRQRALRIGRRISGADTAERIRRKLDLAGNPAGWTVDRVLSGKVIGAVAGLVGGLVFQLMLDVPRDQDRRRGRRRRRRASSHRTSTSTRRSHERAERLQRDLPDAIDLLTISVESGLGFDAAVQQVARNTEGPLAEELSRVLREMQIGQGRADALRAMGERTNVGDLRTFVGAMVQADSFGIPDGAGAAGTVRRDAGQAPSAGRGEGPAGSREDHHPADLLHPAYPVHRGHGTSRAQHHGQLQQVSDT